MTGRLKDIYSFAISLIFHALLIFLISITVKRSLIEIPKVITIELPNINEVPVNDFISKKQEPKKFFKPLQEVISKKSEFEDTSTKPLLSLEEHRKKYREALEKSLEDNSESVSEKSEEIPLSSKANENDTKEKTEPYVSDSFEKSSTLFSSILLESKNRKILYQPPPPVYPEWARREGIQGKVVIKVWFDKDGFAVDAQVVRSSGNPGLDSVAKNYALKFRISPITEDIEEEGIVPVTFELK